MQTRIGFGYDVHQLVDGIPFRLGGVNIHHTKGAKGHSDADALAAGHVEPTNAADVALVHIRHEMAAGTTSSTTFKVRIGGSTAGTLTFNGSGGSGLFAGTIASSLSVTEIAV